MLMVTLILYIEAGGGLMLAAFCLQLCELYDNDCIFDKFNCCMNSDGSQLATGTYSNLFRVIRKAGDWPAKSETVLEASRDPLRRRMHFPKVNPLHTVHLFSC